MQASLVPSEEFQNAKLPERYVAAKQALSDCSQIDECKAWQDLAAAQASYARQANDKELELLAQRIRGRAVRRLGELLKAQKETVGLAKGARGRILDRDDQGRIAPGGNLGEPPGDGPLGPPGITLGEAGISKKLSSQAQRIAEIPEEEFEAAIESEDPPSINRLAERGREELSKPRPIGFKAATEALGTLRRFAEFCKRTDAETVANGLEESEQKQARKLVNQVDSWLDQLIVKLGG